PFTTGIHARRQIGQEHIIEPPSGEARIQLLGVHADQMRDEAITDELPREQGGVHAPERKQGLEAGATEEPFPVRPYVLEKEIAEGDVLHAGISTTRRLDRRGERRLVGVVRRLWRQRNLLDGQ